MVFERNYLPIILSNSIPNRPKLKSLFYISSTRCCRGGVCVLGHISLSYYQPKSDNRGLGVSRAEFFIFGKNLSSTVGITFTRTHLAMVQIAPYQYSGIIG